MTSSPAPHDGHHPAAVAAGWLGPWIALSALALWTASPGHASLLLAASGVVSALIWGPRDRGPAWGAGIVLLIAGILVAFGAERQVNRVDQGWDEYWAAREAEVGARLDEALQARLEAGERAADSLAVLSPSLMDLESTNSTPLQRIRARFGTTALALYDASGSLIAWDGVHRGKVPEPAQSGFDRYVYRDLPLFGYLYVTARGADGSVAVASHLLRTDLPDDLGGRPGDFASEFERAVGEAVYVSDEPAIRTGGTWEVTLPTGQSLLSVVVETADRNERVARLLGRWRSALAALCGLAWLLLAMGGPARLASGTVAAGGLIVLAAFLPFQQVSGLAPLFDPGGFTLPGPLPLTLGRLAVVVLAGFTFIAVLPRPRFRIPAWLGAVLIAASFAGVVEWLGAGIASTRFASGRLEWVVYAISGAALLSLAAGSVVAFTRLRVGGRRSFTALGVVLALLLATLGGTEVVFQAAIPVWWLALWVVPAGLVTVSMGAWDDWQRPLIGWAAAVVLASSAAIPAAWSHRVQTRIAAGAERLEALATPDDPVLEARLGRAGILADSLDARGASDLDVLYSSWRRSGLAESGYPVELVLWTPDGEEADALRVGVGTERPRSLSDLLDELRSGARSELRRSWRDDARYVLVEPLSEGRTLSVVVPPIPALGARSPLTPLFRRESPAEREPLTLIQLLPGDPRGAEELRWVPTASGWQGEISLPFENATYHAHHAVELPTPLLLAARGSLVLMLNLLLFALFWFGGRALLRDAVPDEVRLSGLVISFRARVTLALFGFFVLANAVFGTVAYRTLDQASSRSAQVIAERIVEDAAAWYVILKEERRQSGRTGGVIESLAEQVGTELLEFREGELREGSVEELVELGVYEGWMPLEQQRLLDGREGSEGFSETALGRWQYVTAFRRLPDGDILGVQVPLQVGDTQIRTTDLIELLGFATLLGAALSLVLAWLAGRALTRPIRALQVASEGVGAGDLSLRLPDERSDEFGAVFRAFNRMVGRVRRARRQLVRTSRRTQAIMEEAAVGMVALDPAGLVTVVNPRAEELLGCEVLVGRTVPGEGPLGEVLSGWLAKFLAGSADEADAELTADQRRVRIRARRLGSVGTRRGVVVAMDDITDELRTERVLAWGEMARQVAHEVKNPLTPIKLSVQHVLRAWNDERPEFGEILTKNTDAMLMEIDRLAGIAQSFSRFGAPGGDTRQPLAEVSVNDVVGEVLALYGGDASASARFESALPAELPHVVARAPELKEVLVNLLENARAAIDEGGTVRIEAAAEDDRVVVRVTDDGSGIPDELLPRIFEPQFSTRSTGAGLGLPIVQRLVRAWGGDVGVESRVGFGTTIVVRLRAWGETFEREAGFDAEVGTF